MCTLAATKRRYDTRYPTPATQFTDNFVEKNEVPSYFSRILRFSSSLFVEYNKILCAVCTDSLLYIIRISTCSMRGIPRAAYRHALNDEVKRKLRVIFNVLLFQNISTL